jgi:predicted DsbA family dithiol-disulfide isomerase
MDSSPAAPVRLEVWADPQCVWCYITQPRLHAAIAAYGGPVTVTHRSFQLHPEAPVDVDRDEHVRAQTSGMSMHERDRIIAHLTDLAAAEGLQHRPDLTQPTNSRLALELLHHADTIGKRETLTQRIGRAYFAEGRNIGHLDELLTLASDVGIDPGPAKTALTHHNYTADVDRDTATARTLGAQGVPFYLINDTNALAGTQTTEALLNALRSTASLSRASVTTPILVNVAESRHVTVPTGVTPEAVGAAPLPDHPNVS